MSARGFSGPVRKELFCWMENALSAASRGDTNLAATSLSTTMLYFPLPAGAEPAWAADLRSAFSPQAAQSPSLCLEEESHQ